MVVFVFLGCVSLLIMVFLRLELVLYKLVLIWLYLVELGEKWLIGMLVGEDGMR